MDPASFFIILVLLALVVGVGSAAYFVVRRMTQARMEHTTDRFVTREPPTGERSKAPRPQHVRVENEQQIRASQR
jgi:hypothetical protein